MGCGLMEGLFLPFAASRPGRRNMQKQLYRFQLQDELLPGLWACIDEADRSPVCILEMSLDAVGREGKIAASKQIAAEHGREYFSAGDKCYVTAATPQQAKELRSVLVTRGVLPAPVVVEIVQPAAGSHALRWAAVAAGAIALVLAVGWGLGWWRSRVATPVLSPRPGTFSSAQAVTLSDAMPAATIRYTTDGSQPTGSSAAYTGPLTGLPSGSTVRAIATAPDYADSQEVAGVYKWTVSPAAKVKVSQFYLIGKQAFDRKAYSDARADFDRSCQAGEADGCNYLAFLYAEGLGGPRDVQQAGDIYVRLCAKENAAGCSNLGQLYENDRNDTKARLYFKKACDGGYAEACRKLRNTQ